MFENNERFGTDLKSLGSSKHGIDSVDLQYEICSKFMRIANEQVYQKEL